MPRAAILFVVLLPFACWAAEPVPARKPQPVEGTVVRIADTYHLLVRSEALVQGFRTQLDAMPAADRLEGLRALARAATIDEASAESGGHLGEIFEGQMAPAFDQLVFASPAGAVIGPFRSDFGWHLAYVVAFTSREVGEICRDSLLNAPDPAPQGKARGVGPMRGKELQDLVRDLLGPSWEGPRITMDGNPTFDRVEPKREGDPLVLFTLHVEFPVARLMLHARPPSCARSARQVWTLDCPGRRIAITRWVEYEGRGATGRVVAERGKGNWGRFVPVDPGSWEYGRACGIK